ncbi:MAG: GTPase domain-containing protein [Proteobacteria bacterium]|nr:GTPase domain-containing protein [Pseudomonadota bacterium]
MGQFFSKKKSKSRPLKPTYKYLFAGPKCYELAQKCLEHAIPSDRPLAIVDNAGYRQFHDIIIGGSDCRIALEPYGGGKHGIIDHSSYIYQTSVRIFIVDLNHENSLTRIQTSINFIVNQCTRETGQKNIIVALNDIPNEELSVKARKFSEENQLPYYEINLSNAAGISEFMDYTIDFLSNLHSENYLHASYNHS